MGRRHALAQPGTGRVRVTLNQKVLVHLLPYVKYADRMAAPVAISQQGIADALHVRRSHVALVLQSLGNQGLIWDETVRISGEARRRKAYFLTPHGYERARETEAFLPGLPVLLHGEGPEISFGRALEKLGGNGSVRDLLAYLKSDGVLDPPRTSS